MLFWLEEVLVKDLAGVDFGDVDGCFINEPGTYCARILLSPR